MSVAANSTILLSLIPESTEIDTEHCKLLGGFSLVIQLVLGVIVISVLLVKRARESPRRSWTIWFADISKQLLGQAFIHALNILVSDLIAKHGDSNPCSLYALNIGVDTTIGVIILFAFLTGFSRIFAKYSESPDDYKKGEYGSPFDYRIWVKQALVYLTALGSMKLVVIGLIALPGIFAAADWALSWLDGERGQVLFVMLIFPVIMNVFQFYVIDTFLKATTSSSSSESPPTSHEYQGFLSDEEDSGDEESHIGSTVEIKSEFESRSPTLVSRTALERRDTPAVPITLSNSPALNEGPHSYPPFLGESFEKRME